MDPTGDTIEDVTDRTAGEARIVVVEDEPDLLEVVDYNLRREGYRVRRWRDGRSGLKGILEEVPDLVLLDVMLPGLDGIDVCRRLREDPATRQVPVIMISARGEESDVVLGLGIGADDYVTKPFSPRELMARVKAILRRGPLRDPVREDERLVRGPLLVDARRFEVRLEGRLIDVTPTEYRLLATLARHPGRVFGREELVARAIGADIRVTPRNVDVHVRSLRQKLGGERAMIETVRGAGYRFREDGL